MHKQTEKSTFAQAVYRKMMEKDYCSQWLQIEPLLLAEGHCRIKMKVRREMLNGFGVLHGGIAFTFADSAFAFASNSYGRVAVSINGSMSYAHAAKEGDLLIAEAKALNVTHKTADFDVNVMNEEGQIYYFFRGTVYRKSEEVLG
ncbi:MAG: hotdog fold thioesterase [Saprospiraceae bacterium]|nr:hotdog fold thioesterase [Lewinella sp.]